MTHTQNNSRYLDRMLGPIVDSLTLPVAARIASLQGAPDIQERIDELADKCTEGELSPQEREEYETYVQAAEFIAILQAKARVMLSQQSEG